MEAMWCPQMAKLWHEQFKAAGAAAGPAAIDITEPPAPRKSTHRPPAAEVPDSNAQFDRDFNSNAGLWSTFWDKMGVIPAQVPNVKARLGHLFGLGAGQCTWRTLHFIASARLRFRVQLFLLGRGSDHQALVCLC